MQPTALFTKSHEIDSLVLWCIHVISDMSPVYCKCKFTVIDFITLTIKRNFKYTQRDVFSPYSYIYIFFFLHFYYSERNAQPLLMLRLSIAIARSGRSYFSINPLFSTAFSIQCNFQSFHKQTPSLKSKQKKIVFIILVQTDM